MFFYRRKRDFLGVVVNKESVGKNWEFEVQWLFIGWVVIVSHCWMVACKKIFILPAGIVEYKTSFCWRWKVHLFLFGVTDQWLLEHESSTYRHFQLQFKWDFSLLILTLSNTVMKIFYLEFTYLYIIRLLQHMKQNGIKKKTGNELKK